MTFVPSPYQDIVEDLLTALTGGGVREVHTFSRDTMEYYFENSPAEHESVRIVGIKEKELHNFIFGQDFDADSEKITWRCEDKKVKLPDEGSKYYVNYYKSDVEPVLSDRNVGSVTRTLAESFAREFAVLYQQLLLVYKSGFIDTAQKDSLDQVVAILGETYERKSGDYATGEVLFSRDSPATADIFINDSVQVAAKAEEPKIYETTQEKTLRKGQISVLVPVRATIKGQDGVTGAGTIKSMVQPVLGIDGITNPKEISPTGRAETDDELKERAKHALEAAGKTTRSSIKYALMSIPELLGKDIRVEEDFSQGNGLVRVYIDTEGTGDIVEKINLKIFETKAAGIRVVHNLSKSEGELKKDLKKIHVSLKVMLSLEDPSIASSKKASIKGQVEKAIKNYFGKLKIGESVLKNKLIAVVFGIEGVKNVQFVAQAYLFCWDEIDKIQGNDNKELIEFLKQKYDVYWVEIAKIKKIDDGKTIKASTEKEKKILTLKLNDEKTKVDLKIDDGKTDEFIAKTEKDKLKEKDKLNIYEILSEIKAGSNEKIVLKGEPQVEILDSPVFVDARMQVVITVKRLDKGGVEKSLKDKTDDFIGRSRKKISFNEFMKDLEGNGYEIKSLAFDIEHLESGLIERDIRQGEEIIGEHEAFVLRSVEVKFEG